MDENLLFKFLKKQPKIVLLDLLESAFHEMKTTQKNNVFVHMMDQIAPSRIDRKQVINDVMKLLNHGVSLCKCVKWTSEGYPIVKFYRDLMRTFPHKHMSEGFFIAKLYLER